MADYFPMVRTSYFKPKDAQTFSSFCKRLGLEKIEDTQDGEKLVGFLISDGMGIPDCAYLEEPEECEDLGIEAFFDELAEQLAPGWIVEVREIGYEKLRYFVGVTTIVRWDGEIYSLSLDEIEERVRKEWGQEFKLTACAY